MPIRLHDEDPVLFAEAIAFTSAETGFIPRLIEKDYYCSVLLESLSDPGANLAFKGGTLLAKVHAGFYRLSEDLDFTISTSQEATKKFRSESVAPSKAAVATIADRMPCFRIETPLTGFNGSRQYNALISYKSVLADQRETIKIEIGVREETIRPTERAQAKTLLRSPLRGGRAVSEFAVAALTYEEAMAEKVRAALCRREVAIRDFFDIDHAVQSVGLKGADHEFLELLRRKLQVAGTGPADISRDRYEQLRAQLDAQLRPVLRSEDFSNFNLDRAFETVARIAQSIGAA